MKTIYKRVRYGDEVILVPVSIEAQYMPRLQPSPRKRASTRKLSSPPGRRHEERSKDSSGWAITLGITGAILLKLLLMWGISQG